MNFENYKYYKGEKVNPFEGKDFGRSFWWKVEYYAASNHDDKEKGQLSQTMFYYLKEHHWQGDSHPNTTLQEFQQRARELYMRGIWSRSYITTKSHTIEQAIAESRAG